VGPRSSPSPPPTRPARVRWSSGSPSGAGGAPRPRPWRPESGPADTAGRHRGRHGGIADVTTGAARPGYNRPLPADRLQGETRQTANPVSSRPTSPASWKPLRTFILR
jgi:hypothetical protein